MKLKVKTNGTSIARRAFLQQAGTGIIAAGLLTTAACHKDIKVIPDNGVDLGSGDAGILNFFFAMEQLQAAFFTKVVATPYLSIPTAELSMHTAIRDHDVLHKEFLKAQLKEKALPTLTMDFSSVDFTSRGSVLFAAKAIKNACLEGYNGVPNLIHSPDYLNLVGKISSVEARHTARISDFMVLGTFTGVDFVQGGQNKTNDIGGTLRFINGYLNSKVSAASFNYIAS